MLVLNLPVLQLLLVLFSTEDQTFVWAAFVPAYVAIWEEVYPWQLYQNTKISQR